jgi:hypothetical protein
MTLHIFNPEHDIALASNLSNFTAPHAGRQLRADLGFLPALWAAEGDAVLVEDIDNAARAFRRASRGRTCQVEWVTKAQLATLPIEVIKPWGWDAALRYQLLKAGVDEALLPSDTAIAEIRQLSHRQTSAVLLRQLQGEGLIGESVLCDSEEAVLQQLAVHPRLVLKAPWSSSGRGIRFIEGELNDYHRGWLRNLLKSQGSVMAEPYYQKVKDFGMEFESTDNGIRYLGLSLFHTTNGAYTGNILATEHTKREMMSRYVSLDLLDAVQQQICNTLSLGNYRGPFGIDMMVVRSEECGVRSEECGVRSVERLLHPCVEINLRRTMGHVALALTPTDDDIRKVMRIEYSDHYKLRIRKLYLK